MGENYDPLFPADLFTMSERASGYIGLHILGIIVMIFLFFGVFHFLYLPSFTEILLRCRMRFDTGGAILLAIARSTPEFFFSIMGLFFAYSDIGVGTIIGSSAVNILFASAAFIGQPRHCSWCTHLRNFIFYLIAISLLILFCMDYSIVWWEALILILLYVVYIVFTVFETKLFRCAHNAEIDEAISAELRPIDQINAEPEDQSRNLGVQRHLESWLSKKSRYITIPLITISLASMFLIVYLLTWWGTLVGETFGAPPEIVGSIALSIPVSLIACLSVLSRGGKQLAVHTAMGSNIFLATICNSLPWFINTIFITGNVFLSSSVGCTVTHLPVMYLLVTISVLCARKPVSIVLCVIVSIFSLIFYALLVFYTYAIIECPI